MKKLLKSPCGCLVSSIGLLALLITGAIVHKQFIQPEIEDSMLKKLDSLNSKLENANEKEKELLVFQFLFNDRSLFNRVNLIDLNKKQIFEDIHGSLDDFLLLLKIKNDSLAVKGNEKHLMESLLTGYGKNEIFGPEKSILDEKKFLEVKILEKYKALLRALKENRTVR